MMITDLNVSHAPSTVNDGPPSSRRKAIRPLRYLAREGINIHQNYSAKLCEENFEGRRGTGRNGDAGVVTYVKSSIASCNEVYTKIIPQKDKVRGRNLRYIHALRLGSFLLKKL